MLLQMIKAGFPAGSNIQHRFLRILSKLEVKPAILFKELRVLLFQYQFLTIHFDPFRYDSFRTENRFLPLHAS